jgi:2,4-dienoyl-CoA reductase [(3E)-enoyl-CoA-producing], peroxisomal
MTTRASPFQEDCLRGRVALVTGGGSGICYEIARQLVLHSCRAVIICGRRREFLDRAAQQLERAGAMVQYQVCDVRRPEQCQAVVQFIRDQFGQLDILVNGAAGNFLSPAASLTPNGFATVMAIDALGTFNMCHAAYPLLVKSSTPSSMGIIINISATLQYGATWWQAHASAAKSAVDSLTRSLALEWGPQNIRVVGIAPGPIANTPGMLLLVTPIVTFPFL